MLCRGEEIAKEVIAHKDGSGTWKATLQQPSTAGITDVVHGPSDSEKQVTVKEQSSDSTEVVAEAEKHTSLTPDLADSCQKDSSTNNLSASVPVCVSKIDTGCTDTSSHAAALASSLSHNNHTSSASFSSTSEQKFDENDPAVYCGRRLKAPEINILLNVGPCQPAGFNYPVVSGRAFKPNWFSCEMADKSTYRRQWLSYSISMDKVYCIPCIAFSGPLGSDAWTTSGFNDWHNAIRDLKRHECSPEHRAAEIAKIQWVRGKTVHQISDRNRSALVEDNRKVVECVIDCVRFLTSEMIAFWGNKSSEGKFISLFRLVAKRDPSATAYLLKIEKTHEAGNRMGFNLIGAGNVKNLVQVMKQMVTTKIIETICSQKKACIIFDSTQDYSKREASVLLMRYMEVNDGGEPQVTERLLHVFTTGETSGVVLKEHVLADLKKLNFNIDWLIGQCYDGAGNMRGKYSGLATHMQEHCKKAIYIWCHAHRLNLVVNATAVCSTDIKNTLGLLEELYVFMCGHKRNDVFMKAQSDAAARQLQLKRVSTTRWNSSEAAVDTVLLRYSQVLQALSQLSEPGNDSATITQATGLRSRMRSIGVIVAMHVLKCVYHIIGPASRVLQGITIDLAGAAALLSDCRNQFDKLRADADGTWKVLYQKSIDFALAHGVPTEFPAERLKRKKKMAGEQAADESLRGAEHLKVNTFIAILDEVIQQLSSRFSDQNVAFMKQLSLFTPVSLLNTNIDQTVSVNDIQQICDQYDLSAADVLSELLDFRSAYRVCCGDTGTCQTGTGEHE